MRLCYFAVFCSLVRGCACCAWSPTPALRLLLLRKGAEVWSYLCHACIGAPVLFWRLSFLCSSPCDNRLIETIAFKTTYEYYYSVLNLYHRHTSIKPHLLLSYMPSTDNAEPPVKRDTRAAALAIFNLHHLSSKA